MKSLVSLPQILCVRLIVHKLLGGGGLCFLPTLLMSVGSGAHSASSVNETRQDESFFNTHALFHLCTFGDLHVLTELAC